MSPSDATTGRPLPFAPPVTPPADLRGVGELGAQPVDGRGKGRVRRIDGRDGLDHGQVRAVGCGLGGHGGDVVVGTDGRAGGLGLFLGDDDLQGAGGARAERLLDAVVPDAGGRVLGQHLDGRHRGAQADDRGGEGDEHDQGGGAPEDGATPETLAPGGEA